MNMLRFIMMPMVHQGDSLACEQYAALEQYPDNGVMVINNNEISVSTYISKLLSKVGKGYSQANRYSL